MSATDYRQPRCKHGSVDQSQCGECIDLATILARAKAAESDLSAAGEEIAEAVARGMWQVALECTETSEQDAITMTGDDWHQYLPDAEKLIESLRAGQMKGE